MEKILEDSIRLAAQAANDSWKAGYREGYRAGAKWALEQAQRAVTESFALVGDRPGSAKTVS